MRKERKVCGWGVIRRICVCVNVRRDAFWKRVKFAFFRNLIM